MLLQYEAVALPLGWEGASGLEGAYITRELIRPHITIKLNKISTAFDFPDQQSADFPSSSKTKRVSHATTCGAAHLPRPKDAQDVPGTTQETPPPVTDGLADFRLTYLDLAHFSCF